MEIWGEDGHNRVGLWLEGARHPRGAFFQLVGKKNGGKEDGGDAGLHPDQDTPMSVILGGLFYNRDPKEKLKEALAAMGGHFFIGLGAVLGDMWWPPAPLRT